MLDPTVYSRRLQSFDPCGAPRGWIVPPSSSLSSRGPKPQKYRNQLVLPRSQLCQMIR